jgi:hypothetical protein
LVQIGEPLIADALALKPLMSVSMMSGVSVMR